MIRPTLFTPTQLPSDTSTKTFRKARVALAHQILDGVPEPKLDLSQFFRSSVPEGDFCNTIACGGGWLSLHPFFKECGLRPWKSMGKCYGIEYDKDGVHIDSEFYALDEVFLLPKALGSTAHNRVRSTELFAHAGGGRWDTGLVKQLNRPRGKRWIVSDKELLLRRLRYAYHYHSA